MSLRLLDVDAKALVAGAAAAAASVDDAIGFARRVASRLPLPGEGDTIGRWDALAVISSVDVAVGRIVETHTDAVAILSEAGEDTPGGSWGVFAAEGAGTSLEATRACGEWSLQGTKPWCSLAGTLDHALVTAAVPGGRRLFAVDLHQSSIDVVAAERWVARGLASVPSTPVHFHGAPARPVGGVGWYLDRPGFARGGIGVAACWFGGAVALRDRLVDQARDDDLGLLGAGRADLAGFAARSALLDAAAVVDAGADDQVLMLRTRAIVAAAGAAVLDASDSTLGPAPLCFDEDHARRVADLRAYLGQHHGDRDLVALARQLRA